MLEVMLSAAAFLLSLIAAGWHVLSFMRGADIHFFPPERVLIRKRGYGRGANQIERYCVQINARMTYVNRGQKGYHDIIVDERVRMQLGGQGYDLVAQKFEHTSRKEDNRDELDSKEVSDAIPVVVEGGDAVTHETNFRPRVLERATKDRRRNVLEWDKFLAMIDAREIVFEFSYTTLKGIQRVVKRVVELDDEVRQQLRSRGWAALRCLTEGDIPLEP